MVGKVAVVASALVWASTLVVSAEKTSAVGKENDLRGPASSQVRPLRSFSTLTPDVFSADLFTTADTCKVCHDNLVTSAGEDASIFTDWRTTMMANSSRDPYWMAAVRREVIDHPADAAAIEDECSVCHMPMTTFPERAAGRKGRVFDLLQTGRRDDPDDRDASLAADGVSCTVCHQIQAANLGTPASFTGGYEIDVNAAPGTRRLFGPFLVDTGRTRVMQSASGFQPAQAAHVQQSELCATCHTLFTRALAAGAEGIRLPEQMPYQEWQKSAYKDTQSCQSCHMPVVEGQIPLTQVLGQPREGVSRHTFRGANFFIMKMLNRFRADLGVRATSAEMDTAVARTVNHLQADTARVGVASAERRGDALVLEVDVENLAGHKLPTAYPSRRTWLHVAVRDTIGRVVFESGAFAADGSIAGNDNDADATKFEPHYEEITQPDQVQVYESIMVDQAGRLTTGLLSGVRYIKDNRLLPRGMTRAAATGDIGVQGSAAEDPDFGDGRDRVTYRVSVSNVEGPLTITAELWYQPIGHRWAVTLRNYNAPEPRRFVGYWDAMAGESAMVIAKAMTTSK